MTAWGEALNVPCDHCRHGAMYHVGRDGHFYCAICHCFQVSGSPVAVALREALDEAAELDPDSRGRGSVDVSEAKP